MSDLSAELAQLAAPTCGFAKSQGRRCGFAPARRFENRMLCDEHIEYVERQRAKLRRDDVSLSDLEVVFRELEVDIDALRRR